MEQRATAERRTVADVGGRKRRDAEGRVQGSDRADPSVVEQLPYECVLRMVLGGEVLSKDEALPFGETGQLGRLVRGHCHWLLAKHVLAGRQRPVGPFVVQTGGQ